MQNTIAAVLNQFLILFFLCIPVCIIIWFFASLIMFIRTPKDAPDRPKKRRNLIIASIFFGTLVGLFVLLLCMLMYGVAHM